MEMVYGNRLLRVYFKMHDLISWIREGAPDFEGGLTNLEKLVEFQALATGKSEMGDRVKNESTDWSKCHQRHVRY